MTDKYGYAASGSNTVSPSDFDALLGELLSSLGLLGIGILPILAVLTLIILLVSIPSSSANIGEITSNTKELSDTKPSKRSGKKEYQFCYIDKYKIYKIGNKMTWKTALIALGIANTTTKYTVTRAINPNKISEDAKRAKESRLPWGIFADSQVAAKTLAVALGYNRSPEVHMSGYYGHYHDGAHKIHIWYGKQVWY